MKGELVDWLVCIYWFILQMTVTLEPDQPEARDQDNVGHLDEQNRPNTLSHHLLPPGYSLVGIWNREQNNDKPATLNVDCRCQVSQPQCQTPAHR